jgi:Mg2+-importing ATPase
MAPAPGEIWRGKLEDLYREFSASPDGLSSAEAKARLKKYGQNAIPDKDRREWPEILIAQIASPLLLVLIAASFLSVFLGEVLDTVIILTVIAISTMLGFFQEYKSEKILAELKKYISYGAVALRNGERVQVDARELVPGDVVFVGLGDVIPADMRIIETSGITVNESALTGESKDVLKSRGAVPPTSASPAEIKNGLFMGTTIVDGHAKCLVVSTGEGTFFGSSAALFSAKVPESDFQTGIRKFGSLVLRVVLVMALFVFITNYSLGHGDVNPLTDSILFSLALAVGVAPEMLPIIVTITLSSGSMHLAKKKVITKKLAAIEDLGNMDVLCTDKTGTLTEEGIRLEKYVDLDMRDSHNVFEYAFLCNSAVGTVRVRGNPIDVAIRTGGLSKKIDVSRFRKIHDIPFDYERRRMGCVVAEGRKIYLIVKGAPESVLSACTKARISAKTYGVSEKEEELKKTILSYTKEGYTAIAVAYKEIEEREEYARNDEKDLTFVGFVLLSNPPKSDVRAILGRLKQLGVSLKVISGDDPLVAKKLCSDVGFEISGGRAVTGSELREMKKEEFSKAVEDYNVFARVTPDQKLAIVEALRANGHVVGFLGDGINDAPALRSADVGISVDTAADVAKAASHIILLKKSLDVIADGVEDGRKIFGNIMKYITYTMSANNGNMITVAISSLFLPFIPLLPSQILLNNLLSDVPMVSISRDNVDRSLTRRPQRWNTDFILKSMLFFGAISTFFDLLLICVLYFVMHTDIATFRTAWFLESLLSEIIIVFSLRTYLPFFRSIPSRVLILVSLATATLATVSVYAGPIASLFQFVPLPLPMLAFIGCILIAYFATNEIGKVIFFSWIVPMNKQGTPAKS